MAVGLSACCLHHHIIMEPNANKIKKTERTVIHGDAEQRKERLRQSKEAEGVDTEIAAAWAEEVVARELPQDEAATDTFGERLGEHFMRAATGGDEDSKLDPIAEVVTPQSIESSLEEEVPEVDDLALEPLPPNPGK